MFKKLPILGLFLILCGCNLFAFEPEPGQPHHDTPSMQGSSQNTASEALKSQQSLVSSTSVDASRIALLLPTTGAAASSGQAIRNGFMAAYYEHPSGHSVKLYDTNGQDVLTVYTQALAEGATLVVGPLTKPEVEKLKESSLNVPTLALNNVPTSSAKTDFYQFALSPTDEAQQAAARAHDHGYHSALVIAPANAWGQNIVNAFAKQFTDLGGQVRESLAYTDKTPLQANIQNALQARAPSQKIKPGDTSPDRRQDIDVIFLVANTDKARQIKPLLNFYYANDLPVYATSIIYDGVSDVLDNQDLNGIEFCALPGYLNPALRSQNANATTLSLYAFGYDAYSVATDLGQLGNGLSGATGKLYLKSNQQIYRQVVWARFRNGQASLI